jgi:hypothetical protein
MGLVGLLLVTGSAQAAGGVGGKGDTGGKGGNPPAVPSGGSSGVSGGDFVPAGNATQNQNPDLTQNGQAERKKAWEVGGTWETHRLIRQEDLNGAGPNKLFNVLGVYARYDLTAHDRIALRDYFYERFIADEGETGLRSDDITATYTRTQPLPQQFTFSATGALSAPTSFESQKMGLITSPALILQLDKRLGKYVGVSFRTLGAAYIVKKTASEGGSPNPRARLGGTLEAEVAMPFHEALSFGADVSTGYSWFYDINSAGCSQMDGTAHVDPSAPCSTTADSYYQHQPIQQTYGGELFARYTMPQLVGIKSDITFAFAQGDPSLGYTSVLHDGVGHTYGFYRQTSELYAALTLRY